MLPLIENKTIIIHITLLIVFCSIQIVLDTVSKKISKQFKYSEVYNLS